MIFRTLTFKSTLGFGRNSERTIRNMVDEGEISYLIWVYYNSSHISFMPDVLDAMTISPEERITKPGTDADKFQIVRKRYNTERLASMTDEERMNDYINKKQMKALDAKFDKIADNVRFSKQNMQARNHGKKT